VRADLDAGELRDRDLFGAVVKQNDVERIAGVLGAGVLTIDCGAL